MLVIMEEFDMLSRIIYGTATIRSEIKLAKKFDEDILYIYYKKKTDTLLTLYDSSFNGRLSHELQVKIATIYTYWPSWITRSW